MLLRKQTSSRKEKKKRHIPQISCKLQMEHKYWVSKNKERKSTVLLFERQYRLCVRETRKNLNPCGLMGLRTPLLSNIPLWNKETLHVATYLIFFLKWGWRRPLLIFCLSCFMLAVHITKIHLLEKGSKTCFIRNAYYIVNMPGSYIIKDYLNHL